MNLIPGSWPLTALIIADVIQKELLMKQRGNIKVLMHHRTSDVYTNGRYLHVDMKISTRSKRGREIARETAGEILRAVGLTEIARDIVNKQADNAAMTTTSGGEPFG